MKKKLAVLAALSLIALVPNLGRAVNGNVNVTARIAPPLRIDPVTTLNFGLLLPDGINAGTSVISTAGAQTNTNLSQVTPAAVAAGAFNLVGRGGATVNTLSIAGTTLNCAIDTDPVNDCVGGANTLTITLPTLSAAAPLVLPAGAGLQTQSVSYGAQLNASATQTSGVYTGVLVVTAAY